MFPQELQEYGWQFSFLSGCWHFIIRTGSETGTRFDFVFGTTLIRYDWFISNQRFEIETKVRLCVTHDDLKAITEGILPFGFAEDY